MDIKKQSYEPFVGKFGKNCQESFIPESVQALVTMILRGSEEDNTNPYFKQAMLTIGQMMIFNCTIRTRRESTSSYHSQMREPPLAIYLAQMIHCRTRKIGIVEKLSHLGLCISSNSFQNISTSLGNTAIENFEKDGVVCPRIMRFNHFTVAAVDNIDVNPTSSQAMSSLHGTAASLHQKYVMRFREEETWKHCYQQRKYLKNFLWTIIIIRLTCQFHLKWVARLLCLF